MSFREVEKNVQKYTLYSRIVYLGVVGWTAEKEVKGSVAWLTSHILFSF